MASLNIQISSGTDDAEEHGNEGGFWSGGETENGSSDLELCWEVDNSQYVGLRFQNVTIPQGSTINSAIVRFIIDAAQTGAVTLDIWGDDTDDATGFPNEGVGAGTNNISGRTPTTATATWNIGAGEALSVNDQLDTVDISSVIQEIVDRGGWVSGNALVVIIHYTSGTNLREVESYDGESGDAARLIVDYTAPSGTTVKDIIMTNGMIPFAR